MCLYELSLVDDTIEAIGAPKKYQRLRKWIIRIIIGWIVYTFYDLAGSYIWFFSVSNLNVQYYIKIIIRNYPNYITLLNVLILGTIIWLVNM